MHGITNYSAKSEDVLATHSPSKVPFLP